MDGSLQQLAWTILTIMAVCVAVAFIGLLLIARSVRRLRIPPDADFFSTMRMVPLSLVIFLDLLDFGLDIFSAPIIWVLLDRMGLPNLRNKATIEAVIPITGPIPTFTICWFAARLFGLGSSWYYEEPPRRAYGRGTPRLRDERRYDESRRRSVHVIDMDDD
jgi:hypothetical protein